MTKFPCKDCKKRELGCHSKCQEYIAAVEAQRKISEDRLKVFDVNDYVFKRNLRIKHYLNKK